MVNFQEVWETAALAFRGVFGTDPDMRLDRAPDGRPAVVFAGFVWLYQPAGRDEDESWAVEVRVAHLLAFRDRPCLRLLQGDRTEHHGLESALVTAFLHVAHTRTHDAIDAILGDEGGPCPVRNVGEHN